MPVAPSEYHGDAITEEISINFSLPEGIGYVLAFASFTLNMNTIKPHDISFTTEGNGLAGAGMESVLIQQFR